MHINDLVASIEADISSADSRERQARRELDAIINDAQRSGRRNLTADEDARSEALFRTIEQAREARRGHAERLTRARAAQAEDSEADRRSREVRSTGVGLPGGDGTSVIGRQDGSVGPGAVEGPTWRYADSSRSAAVERGQSFRGHEVVREQLARDSGRDNAIIGQYGISASKCEP
jgi:hypothetical protein